MSFQQIADYGKTIIDQYRDWMLKQDLNALRKSLLEASQDYQYFSFDNK